MEVEKKDTPAVVMPTEKERKFAIEKMQLDERNKRAEEKSRVDGFMPELNALCQKWNVNLIGDVRMIGSGANPQTTINIGVQALPAKESDVKAETATIGDNPNPAQEWSPKA